MPTKNLYNFDSFDLYNTISSKVDLFKNTEDGWHGVTEVTSKLNRQILNLVIMKKDN